MYLKKNSIFLNMKLNDEMNYECFRYFIYQSTKHQSAGLPACFVDFALFWFSLALALKESPLTRFSTDSPPPMFAVFLLCFDNYAAQHNASFAAARTFHKQTFLHKHTLALLLYKPCF